MRAYKQRVEDSKAKDEEEGVELVKDVARYFSISIIKQYTSCKISQTPHIHHVSIVESLTM